MYNGGYSVKAREKMISIIKENDDLDSLHDVIGGFFDSFYDKSEEEQENICNQILINIPDHIMGSIYSWGISDTEVRDSIYTFIEENEPKVRKLTGLI
jgi:hypothetical protein